MIYIISQILALLAFIVSLVAFHRKNKKNILGNMIISNILNLLHYLLLGAYSGCITKVIAILRDSFIIYKEKNKKLSSIFFLFIFLVIYLVTAIITYDGILSLFPLFAATSYIVFIWNGKELTIKRIALVGYFLWLGYNIYVMSIIGIISNVVAIISVIIAIINYKKASTKF